MHYTPLSKVSTRAYLPLLFHVCPPDNHSPFPSIQRPVSVHSGGWYKWLAGHLQPHPWVSPAEGRLLVNAVLEAA